jgi:uncharacterized protein
MKNILVACLLLFVFLESYCQPVSKPDADSIRVKAIPFRCLLLDAPKAFKVISTNAVVLTAAAKTDFHNPANGCCHWNNAPKFLFIPDTNFEFSARVEPAFNTKYDGGALLVYSDQENWAKLLLEYTADRKPLIGMSVVRNKLTDDNYYYLDNAKKTYLRVTKTSNVFNFFTSTDGTNWILLREFVYATSAPIQLGFYSQSPVGDSCVVEFSDIVYKRVKN